jgi:hypothetical protein
VTVGGGGGTFVVSDGVPLIVASGGDGGVYSTGYLRSEFVPDNFQFRVSMSADGNVYAAIEVNLITFQFTLKIYRYLSGVWTPEFTAPSAINGVVISGDGKTVAFPTSNSIAVYEYIDQIWQTPRYITNIDWDYVFNFIIQISYDGNTIVTFTRDIASNWHLYVCTKNQNLTWNTEELSAPGIDTFTVYQSSSCAISGDGTRIFAAADDINSFPRTTNVWSYSRTNNTWGLPELYTSIGSLRVESTSVSYDGQIVAIYAGNLQTDPREGYLYVYDNGIRTRNLTFPWTVNQYPAGAVQISYDGSLALVILITGKILVTPSTQITIFDDASGFPLPSGSINSTASRIVSPYYDVANPITYFFEVGGSGQPGSFLPSGTGSGISGAGYLTDGQQTNPFFGFLKPKAYVNGGFGNSYEYGQPGIPKEGGFGGGQSPLNKQTDLTSVSGYNQFRPTIPLVSSGLNGMAISEDANTFLASFGVGNSGTSYTNVYAYNGTSWVSTNLYTTTFYGQTLAMSGDGSVWLINADVWRNGSFEIQLQDFALQGIGFNVTDISRDGNTAMIMYGQSVGGGYYDKTVRLIVYSSSGSWSSITLFSQDPDPEFAGYTCAMSADGNTIVMSYSVPTYVFVNVYRRVDGTWSGPNQILYQNTTSRNSIPLQVNSDGSVITLSIGSSGSYQYSNGVLSMADYRTYSLAFSRTDPNLYAWVDFSAVHVPSISLEVNVQVDPAGIDIIRMGSNVLAMSKILTPHAIVFLDMYDPTTTCTAVTSIDHGYPYDYEVQITGTQYFNGTWLIAAGSSNTFTFQAFGGPTVTSGYVSGTTTGISGGGGYTGSPGDGVSSATCYADESVANFTDLGAASNSAGYVTVSLVDPPPLKQTWSLLNWSTKNQIFEYGNFVWFDGLGCFVAIGDYSIILTSKDGVTWTSLPNNLPVQPQGPSFSVYLLKASPTTLIAVEYYSGIWSSTDAQNWTLTLDKPGTFNTAIEFPYFSTSFANGYFIVRTYVYLYVSTDGISWTELQPNVCPGKVVYGNGTYLGIVATGYPYRGILYTSTDLVTWSDVLDSNVASNTSLGWTDIIYENGTFIASSYTPAAGIPFSYIYKTVTSSDGITWIGHTSGGGGFVYGNGTFVSLYDKSYTTDNGETWNSSFGSSPELMGAYSPISGYYLFTDGFQFYVSLDGKYIVPTQEAIPIGRPTTIVWADSLGIFAANTGCSIIISHDGSLWTEVLNFGIPDSDNGGSVSWSPELGIIIAYFDNGHTGYAPWLYTSNDGLTWTKKVLAYPLRAAIYNNFNTRYHNPCWSPELGIFTSGDAISKNGVDWTWGFQMPYSVSIAWSSKLKLFAGLQSESGTYYSTDGLTWIQTSSVPMTFVTWSPLLEIFVGCHTNLYGMDRLRVYISTDGISWTESYLGAEYVVDGRVIWAQKLDIFLLLYRNPGSNIIQTLSSPDGVTWSLSPSFFNFFSILGICWSPELEMFAGVNSFNSAVQVLTASKTF